MNRKFPASPQTSRKAEISSNIVSVASCPSMAVLSSRHRPHMSDVGRAFRQELNPWRRSPCSSSMLWDNSATSTSSAQVYHNKVIRIRCHGLNGTVDKALKSKSSLRLKTIWKDIPRQGSSLLLSSNSRSAATAACDRSSDRKCSNWFFTESGWKPKAAWSPLKHLTRIPSSGFGSLKE